jgi:S1-C subfamily serine protease
MTLILVVAISLVALGMAPDSADAVKKKSKDKDHVGYLGVSLQELTDEIIDGLDLKIRQGVLVNEVFEASPAEEAGILDGDVIIVFDGEKIRTPNDLIKLVRKADVGDKVKLKVVREDDTKTIAVIIGERPERFAVEVPKMDNLRRKMISIFKPGVQLGVKIQDLEDSDLAEYFDVQSGVLVTGVIENSSAEDVGVKAGDVIIGLNDEDVDTGEGLIELVQEMEEGDDFELVVVRHGRKKTLSGQIKKGEEHSSYWIMGDEGDDHSTWTHKLHVDEDTFKDTYKDLGKSFRFHIDEDELRSELEDLRDELKKLKEELKDKLKELEEE